MSTFYGFGDSLVVSSDQVLPERFFDRFMFNAHPADGRGPWLIVGAGAYPTRDVMDGFAVIALAGEQRNVRFSTELRATDGDGVGPLSWTVVEPGARWRLRFDDPAAGVALDLDWTARAPAWEGVVGVTATDGTASAFDHLFQSGLATGELIVDGVAMPVRDWYSQRDRSRGVRTLTGGQGLHLWVQAQFPDRCIGFLMVDDREHRMRQLEGAIMHTDGRIDPIVAAGHDLRFDEGLDLRGGALTVVTGSGERVTMDVDSSARGGYMAGGGYGGSHGRVQGRDHVERDSYPLDGSVSPRSLDTALTDRLARFASGEAIGSGIIEFAHSRSDSYRYRPRTALAL